MLNRTGPSIDPWGTPLVTGLQLHASDHYPPGPSIQPVYNPPHCLLIQPTLHQLVYEDLMGDRAESLTEIHCFPLIY